MTGEIEFDGRGDRERALYFVLQVVARIRTSWSQNRIVKQVTAGRPRT